MSASACPCGTTPLIAGPLSGSLTVPPPPPDEVCSADANAAGDAEVGPAGIGRLPHAAVIVTAVMKTITNPVARMAISSARPPARSAKYMAHWIGSALD